MNRLRRMMMIAGVSGAIGLGTVFSPVEAREISEPVPIVRDWQPQQVEISDGFGVGPAVLWSIAGITVSGVVLGTLYLFKRRVGGFPENPTWVAPITIMRSRDNATEETFGLADSDAHDHGPHH